MKAKKKAWIVIIVLAVIGFCVGFYFGYKGEKDKQEQTDILPEDSKGQPVGLRSVLNVRFALHSASEWI